MSYGQKLQKQKTTQNLKEKLPFDPEPGFNKSPGGGGGALLLVGTGCEVNVFQGLPKDLFECFRTMHVHHTEPSNILPLFNCI